MMMNLLKIYESVREEYIELLKKGFLVFFPYLLGTRWRENFPNRYVYDNMYDVANGSLQK